MTILRPLAFLLFAATASSGSPAEVCGDSHGRPGVESAVVHLHAKPERPAFYFRSEGYVVFIAPEVVLESLESIGKSRPADRLNPLIRACLPLAENQDLFQFELADWTFWPITQALVIKAIETGDASITNEGGVWSDSVRVVHERRARINGTTIFDGQSGRNKIIWQLDCIAD
jgi:hypothetical protein